MADVTATFEALERAQLRSWLDADRAGVKSSVAGDCVMMFGTAPPVLLDRASFLAAIDRGLVLKAFRLREVTARQYGRSAWFTGHAELELALGQKTWQGGFLLTDLWRKSRLRRRWLLTERALAPVEGNAAFAEAIGKLQLWR